MIKLKTSEEFVLARLDYTDTLWRADELIAMSDMMHPQDELPRMMVVECVDNMRALWKLLDNAIAVIAVLEREKAPK